MNFVSETDLAEQRKIRQEEWERVRKADDPKEAPEVVYDPRCLFDQLQEHKDKKQEEFEEKIKFKNQFRGIDSEEADFLTDIANRANKLEQQKRLEEEKEISKLKNNVVIVSDNPSTSDAAIERKKNEEKLNQALQSKNKNKKSQYALLKGAIKRKSTTTTSSDVKSSSPKVCKQSAEECTNEEGSKKNEDEEGSSSKKKNEEDVVIYPSGVKCAGFLPGIGTYYDSSDSSYQTSDEEIGGC